MLSLRKFQSNKADQQKYLSKLALSQLNNCVRGRESGVAVNPAACQVLELLDQAGGGGAPRARAILNDPPPRGPASRLGKGCWPEQR